MTGVVRDAHPSGPLIAELVFDAPLDRAYAYRVPEALRVAPGQRARAPLGPTSRVGLIVSVRAGAIDGLRTLEEVIDPEPLLDRARLDLVEWIAARSLSSIGSTAAGLLPPAGAAEEPRSGGPDTLEDPSDPLAASDGDTSALVPGGTASVSPGELPELFIGAGREGRLLAEIAAWAGGVLVVVADLGAAARWATRLAKLGRVVRLDSGAGAAPRATGWRDLGNGTARLAVGTRSALLAPLPAPVMLVLIDEQDAAHRPPGHPRIHAREVLLERAERERARVVLTAGTPSVEMWWRADRGRAVLVSGAAGPWPSVTLADTRGILRREPLTPELARALRETLAAGSRAFLAVSRLASALACDECGGVLRCDGCGLALGYSRAGASLACRVCAASLPAPETCPGCQGRRLSPFGWGAERVEHAVRRRFPHARVARYEPETRGARAAAQREVAATADVVIGTRGALRLFGRGTLGLAGFVTPDQLLRVPDFRASERMLALLWGAAERVQPDGALVIQSQNPAHHAFAAVTAHDLRTFYAPELSFRAELGYPPFRRLATITVRQRPGRGATLAVAIAEALRGVPDLTVYPPAPAGSRGAAARIVVKGGEDLPRLLDATLAEFPAGGRRERGTRGIMDVEVDPVEWQF